LLGLTERCGLKAQPLREGGTLLLQPFFGAAGGIEFCLNEKVNINLLASCLVIRCLLLEGAAPILQSLVAIFSNKALLFFTAARFS
jgi:hypothetical protein